MKKMSKMCKTCFVLALLLVNAGVVYAQTCQNIFPGPVQNYAAGGRVTFDFMAQVSGASGNLIYTNDLRDNGGPTNSCTTGDCAATDSVAPSGTYSGGYPGGANISAGYEQPVSLAPGNYGSFNHSGGNLNGKAVVTLQPGVYTFSGAFKTGNSVRFVLASTGTAAIFVQGAVTLGFQSQLNMTGVNRYVFMHSSGDITISTLAQAKAVFYSGNDVTVSYRAQVTGAITARNQLTLSSETLVAYNSAQITNANFNDFCSNGPIAPPAPIAEWHLDENTWSGAAGEIIDTSGNNLHGYSVALGGNHPVRENTSPALTSDPGTCAYGNFNGVNDGHLRIDDPGSNSILDLNSEFAVAVWIYPRSWATADLMSIVSKNENFEFHLNGNGQVNWWWGGNPRELTTASAVSINQWHHIVISYESGNQVIYIDGNAAATNNNTQAITLNNDPVLIGTDLDFNRRNFNGYIDEAKIYNQSLSAAEIAAIMAETHVCPVSPLIDDFSINVGGASASTCAPRAVTITALDNSNNTLTTYTGSLNISTSTGNGDWAYTGTGSDALGTLTPGASDSGVATYAFEPTGADQGSITLNLSNTHAETLTTTIAETTNSVLSTSSALTFSENAFVITATDVLANDVIAGRTHNFQVAMHRRDTTTGICSVASNYNVSDVKAWVSRLVTDPGGTGPQISNASATDTEVLGNTEPVSANLTLPFVNGLANFTLLASDVGTYTLNMRDSSTSFSDQNISGSTSNLVARPFGFAINVASNPAASGAGGSPFVAAGSNFNVDVRAVAWSAADDANNDGLPDGHGDLNPANNTNLLNNTTLSSFGNENPVEALVLSSSLVAPAGGVNPGLGNSLSLPADGRVISSFSGGSGTTSSVHFAEVGVIELAVNFVDGNYLGAGATFSSRANSRSTYIGRFIPASFSASSGSVTEACTVNMNYSYMGEAFDLEWQLNALNTFGNLTINYEGAFAKLDGGSAGVVNFAAIDAAAPTPLSSRLQNNTTNITWTAGSGEANSSLTLARESSPDGPYSQLSLGVTAMDSDGVSISAASFDLDSDNNAANDAVELGQTEVRFGRLRLDDAFGPETANLPVNFLTEYWSGSAWISNIDDSCTAIALSAISYPGGTIDSSTNLTVPIGAGTSTGNYASTAGSAVNFANGDAGHYFSAPGAGNMGNIQVNVDLALYPWLQFDWNQDGNHSEAALPTANYDFGSYRGHDRVIYWQEILK